MTTTKDDDAQGRDEQRVAEIRAKHAPFDFGMRHPISGKWSSRVSCKGCHRPWPCEPAELLARLGALEAERDEWRAKAEQQAQLKADFRAAYQAAQQAGYDMEALRDRAEAERDDALARLAAAEAALAPCTLAREYRDGVTCRDERDDKGVCFNHRVVRGLRVHAVTADRLELENRALRRQVRATYGILHEGLHGGKPTDPEHQELCERPACRNARAALAGSREQAAEGAGRRWTPMGVGHTPTR